MVNRLIDNCAGPWYQFDDKNDDHFWRKGEPFSRVINNNRNQVVTKQEFYIANNVKKLSLEELSQHVSLACRIHQIQKTNNGSVVNFNQVSGKISLDPQAEQKVRKLIEQEIRQAIYSIEDGSIEFEAHLNRALFYMEKTQLNEVEVVEYYQNAQAQVTEPTKRYGKQEIEGLRLAGWKAHVKQLRTLAQNLLMGGFVESAIGNMKLAEDIENRFK